jgi:hypothetical protein
MRKDRFIVGLLCCTVAVIILLFAGGAGRTTGAVAFGVLGIAMMAVSKRG